ncbi:hypothetical protein APA_3978 [Pseudanabaena sp. lw0831]|nr:hypothetical protein APA_3978 [Pseudanabaena sp. lw0831]
MLGLAIYFLGSHQTQSRYAYLSQFEYHNAIAITNQTFIK